MSSSRPGLLRVILFDVGNTLTHVDLTLVSGLLEDSGCPVSFRDLRRAEAVGRGTMYRQFEEAPGGRDKDRWTVYMETMLAALDLPRSPHYHRTRDALLHVDHGSRLWRHVPGAARKVLDSLTEHGFRLGVISNSDGGVAELLEDVGLAGHFEVIVDSHLVGVEKPDPRIFEIALERMGARASETAYVGDFYSVDVIGARSANVFPVLFDPLGVFGQVDCAVIRELERLEDALA